MTVRADLVILGAGPTGLGALQRFFELQSQSYIGRHVKILIIDKEAEAGGLSRTLIDSNGFKWDIGVHVIGTSKFPAFLKMLTDTIPEHDWNVIKRCVKVDITGIGNRVDKAYAITYAPYPVQNSIHYFPIDIRDKCLDELERRKPMRSNKHANFAEFSRLHFGSTLQSVFIRPYNEKVWTVPIEEMNCRWVEGRVPKIDLNLLKRRCKSPVDTAEEEQDEITFRYPSKCDGIGDLWKRFADKFPQKVFIYNTEVLNIDTSVKKIFVRNTITGEETEVLFELMVSTIPLTELNKLCGLFSSLKLRHSTVILVGVGLHKPQNDLAKRLSWSYFPRQAISFYRCTVVSNFSDNLTPDSNRYWSVLCEIGCRPEAKREPREVIIKKVIRDLIDVKIVDNKDQVYSTYFSIIPYGFVSSRRHHIYLLLFGYPIPTLERDQELIKYQHAFEDCQIFSRGRFGSWKYELSNTDHCFEIGRQIVEKLYLDVDERIC